MLPLHPALLSQPDYLFSQIAAAAEEERKRHPHRRVISLGIGDVTQPIAPVAAAALRTAAAELATQKGQKGYGPAAGYPFLREAIAASTRTCPAPSRRRKLPLPRAARKPWGRSFPCGSPACRSGSAIRSTPPTGPRPKPPGTGFPAALPGGK